MKQKQKNELLIWLKMALCKLQCGIDDIKQYFNQFATTKIMKEITLSVQISNVIFV